MCIRKVESIVIATTAAAMGKPSTFSIVAGQSLFYNHLGAPLGLCDFKVKLQRAAVLELPVCFNALPAVNTKG